MLSLRAEGVLFIEASSCPQKEGHKAQIPGRVEVSPTQ